MDDQIKKSLKRAVEQAESGLAKSLLLWKYRGEGKPSPLDRQLENESRLVAGRAHEALIQRGRNILRELRKAYRKDSAEKEDSDE